MIAVRGSRDGKARNRFPVAPEEEIVDHDIGFSDDPWQFPDQHSGNRKRAAKRLEALQFKTMRFILVVKIIDIGCAGETWQSNQRGWLITRPCADDSLCGIEAFGVQYPRLRRAIVSAMASRRIDRKLSNRWGEPSHLLRFFDFDISVVFENEACPPQWAGLNECCSREYALLGALDCIQHCVQHVNAFGTELLFDEFAHGGL